MIFTEARFLLFFAVVWIVHWTAPSHAFRKGWLLAASLLFYGVCGPWFLALMIGTALIDYVAGLMLARTDDDRTRRWILVGSLVSNLGVLGFFKYAGFFAENVRAGLALAGIDVSMSTLEIGLPVGISFYTFQSLSYTIDVWRRQLAPVRNVVDFLFFVTFFPQLVAGPIVRATDFLPQTAEKKFLGDVRLRTCALLFLVGFVKKACVADHAARAVDDVFREPGAYGAASLWLADALYAVQIYCDFSGYSDMAIACAGAFGYRLTRNFDFPYLARSVTDFWRRWHISLSTWFRDYLYIPLGGNRGGAGGTARNLVLVFFLCGLWHGAAWTFVVWGLLHGAALMIERGWAGRALAAAPRAAGAAWTLLLVLVGWVFFRAEGLGAAAEHVAGMFGAGSGAKSLPAGWWALVAAFAAMHVVASKDRLVPRIAWSVPRWAFAALFGLAVGLVLPWIAIGYTPFIYFQF
ncbi:MAG: Peptidoglycan O-acetyltransferase [Planctomycetes bacterium]|nr:Peptidoglycan O-acetyltransferase [Planctomycetota bacterium]